MADVATLPLLLKQLRLPTMAHLWEDLALQAEQRRWTLGQYLAALCEEELIEREQRRLARYLKESHLPPAKTVAQLDFDAAPALPRQQILALAQDASWVERAENLLLFGPSGVGKTHIAAAMGHGLVAQGFRVRFTPATHLVQELQVAKQALQLPDALAKLDKYRLLILDDLGYVQRSEMETAVLFELIAHRYESGSLLITSNYPFSDWDRIFPDSVMTVAAIDRLVHHAQILTLQGDSYRKTQSLAHLQEASPSLPTPSAQPDKVIVADRTK